MKIEKYVETFSKDLTLKNYSQNTIKNYVNQVELFLRHFESISNKPSEISEKQVKDYLLLTKSVNARKHRLSALKLFYELSKNCSVIHLQKLLKFTPTFLER